MRCLELSKQKPIEIHDRKEHVWQYVPEKKILENIPVIWEIQEQIISDWRIACQTIISANKNLDGKDALFEFNILESLKIRLFQSLFSYVTFFFMLEDGYKYIYFQLNEINHLLCIDSKNQKPPKRTEFITNLWRLRDFTIAHWAGTEKRNVPESIAGRDWGFGFSTKSNDFLKDIEHLVPLFSGFTVHSIPEMHDECSKYLLKYDYVCANFLNSIVERMPIVNNDIEYNGWKWTINGLVSTRK